MCTYLGHIYADLLTIVQFCVNLMALENCKCGRWICFLRWSENLGCCNWFETVMFNDL